MCESDKTTTISANDADLMPNSGPFQWVLEDHQTEGKWKIVPITGTENQTSFNASFTIFA